MTHREHAGYDVFFSSLLENNMSKFWLLMLEAGDVIHSWTCQTECTQTITDERVNRPAVHPSRVTPWQLYGVWGHSPCHPQWFVPAFLSHWLTLNQLLSPHYGRRGGECRIYSFIYFVALCYWKFLVCSLSWGWLADSIADLFLWPLPDSTRDSNCMLATTQTNTLKLLSAQSVWLAVTSLLAVPQVAALKVKN